MKKNIILNTDFPLTIDDRSTFTEDPPTSLSEINPSDDEDSSAQNYISRKNGCTSGLTWFPISYNILVHVVLFSYTLYFTVISFYNESPYSIFCWHVPFMLIGV